MYVVAMDKIVADIATELEMTPTEASLIYRDVVLEDDEDDFESANFDS